MHPTLPLHRDPALTDESVLCEPLRVDAGGAWRGRGHAFVACKETHRTTGAWRVRINSRHARPAVLYPTPSGSPPRAG